MSEQVADSLSAAEQAYFDSKGETDIPAEAATPEPEDNDAPPADASDAQPEGDAPQPEGEPEADKRRKMVPHQALHEAREEAKQTKAELARIREEKARFEETVNQRLALIMNGGQPAMQPQQPEGPPPPPNPAENPIEALEWMAENQRRIEQTIQQQQHQAKEREARQHVEQFKAADEHHARQAVPDYDQAKEYLGRMVAQQLVIQSGGRATQAQINAALQAEEERITVNAIMQQVRPAQRFYELALASGWKPPAKQGQGATPQKIEDIAKAQDANRSLSSAGGSAGGGDMTAERLANMSEADFAAYMAKNPRAFKRFAGG